MNKGWETIDGNAFEVTRRRAVVQGIPLAAGEEHTVELTFSADTNVRANHPVIVRQIVGDNEVGGIVYVLQTGHD